MTFLVILSTKSYPEIVGLIISPNRASLLSISVTWGAVASFGGATICGSGAKGAGVLGVLPSIVPFSTTNGSGGLGEVILPLYP